MRPKASCLRVLSNTVFRASVLIGLVTGAEFKLAADTKPIITPTPTNYTLQLTRSIREGTLLIWLGDKAPAEAESKELWEALQADRSASLATMPGNAQAFIKAHPDSSWNPSLQVYLGERDFKQGYFSTALERWESVWNKTKDLTDDKGRYLADSALTDRLQLLASLGRTQTMKSLFDETKTRKITGACFSSYNRTRDAYRHMITRPEDSYRCGTLALDAVTQKLYGTNNYWGLVRQKSPDTGFSMSALEALAESNHLGLVAVRRPSGNELVAPSVIHWKQNHYAAIVEQKGDMFKVVDPTFTYKRWLTAAAINAESSGEFLVPEKQVPSGWRNLSSEEASQIFGKGYPNHVSSPPGPPCGAGGWAGGDSNPSPTGNGPIATDAGGGSVQGPNFGNSGGGGTVNPLGPGGCSTCGPRTASVGGMPTWQITEPDLNLWIEDEPLAYMTATGDRFSFKIYYDQFDYQNNPFPVGEMGYWGCSWISTIVVQNLDNTLIVYPPGGGQTSYTNFDGTVPEFYSNNRLFTLTNSDGTTNGYEILHPDGAEDIYTVVYDDGSGTLLYYLTQQLNPHGRATTFNYNMSGYPYLLTNVIDSDGKTNTISYTYAAPYPEFSQITDPYGHTVTFSYELMGLPEFPTAYLTNVTDIEGLSTSFSYDFAAVGLTNMVTPYGPTTFQMGTSGTFLYDVWYQYNIITLPNNETNMFVYVGGVQFPDVPEVYTDTSNVPTNRPADNTAGTNTLDNPDWSNPIANDRMNLANSFYWNAEQFAQLSSSFLSAVNSSGPGAAGTFDLLATNDYANGRMRHYNQNNSNGQGRTLSVERQPSPNGIMPGKMIWYDYPGKPDYNVEGTSAFPSMKILVLPDGTETYTIYQTDQFGNWTNVISTYSSNGTVLTRTNTYLYATNGIDMVESIGPDRVTTNCYGYDATGLHLVLLTTNAVGYVTTNTYNTNAQLTSVSSPTGLVTTNIYDNNGLLVTNYSYAGTGGRTEYFGTNSYTYTNGLILTHTDARNLTITNSWDALMRLTNIAYPDGNISYTYSNLDLVKVVDRMGLTTSYGYNSIRQKVATTNALGHYTLYSYCLCGGLDEIVDSLGNTTTLNYDNAGRVVSKIYADGSSITNNFNSIGQITNTIDGRGASTTNWFNNQGLLLTVSNAFGQVRQVSYDIDDRITSQVDNNGVIVSMSYDNLGRTLTRTYPDGGVERLGYSPFGLVAYTNQLTNSTFYYYDAKQRKIAETNALNQITQYGYDPAGDLTNLIDQKSDSTAWGYDQYGRVTNKMDATISTILTYDYDADNRLTNRWSAQKGNTGYKYDAVGNLTNVVYPTSHALAFGYDADNRMTSMSDAVGTTSFTYTQTGQLASETGPWTNDAVAYTYVDRLRTELDLQQPNAADWIQTYVYDSANRMSGITSPAGTFNYFYNPGLAGAATSSSLVAEISLPNGAMITNTFDNNARELGTLLLNNGGSNLDSYTYTYNVGNQRTSVQRAGVGDTNTANYGYDVIGQVLSDTASEGTTNRLNEQLHYGFDPAGNLAFRTNNALIQNFAVNSLNELTSNTNGGTLTVMGTTTSKATAVTVNSTAAGVYGDAAFAAQGLGLTTNYTAIASDSYGRSATNTVTVSLSTNVTFQYDLNGNLTNDGLRSFAYDDENELIQVWVTNQWMSQFAYDAKMRRRIRQEFTWSGSSWTQTNAVYYVYDGNLVIQERGINNLPATTYARGKDLSGSLEGAGGIGGLLARTTQSYADAPMAGHAFYHSDGNGNVTCLINGSQAIVAKYLYDAFGNILSKSGLLADANLYRFSSKEVHVNSGLVYYLYRYYDPNLQRWPNRDPWREAGFGRTRKQNAVWTRPSADPRFGLDLYRFVENQPPNGRDSLGLYTISVACLAAQQAADVALQIASEDPTPENVAAAQAAVAAAYAACKEPPPPLCYAPPPPSPPPPDCWPKGDPPDGVKQYVCQEYLASCISCCEQNNPITGGGGGQAGYNQCVAACHKSYQDCLGNLGP